MKLFVIKNISWKYIYFGDVGVCGECNNSDFFSCFDFDLVVFGMFFGWLLMGIFLVLFG